MKGLKNKKTYLTLVIVIGLLFTTAGIARAALSNPGSQDDPLVTLSYIEKRFEQLKFYIDEKIQSLQQEDTQLTNRVEELESIEGSSGAELIVVQLKKGQKLILKSGTEVILRSGKAKAIAGELGGLSDVTGAKDLQTGQDVPTNHLVIIPRDDGRGLEATTDIFVMVRGQYQIK